MKLNIFPYPAKDIILLIVNPSTATKTPASNDTKPAASTANCIHEGCPICIENLRGFIRRYDANGFLTLDGDETIAQLRETVALIRGNENPGSGYIDAHGGMIEYCQACGSQIGSRGDCVKPDCLTHQLFFLRCNGDNSWLGDDGKFHLVTQGNWKASRIDWLTSRTFDALIVPASIYEIIPVTLSLADHIEAYLGRRATMHFQGIYAHLRSRCPWRLTSNAVIETCNFMLHQGRLKLSDLGPGLFELCAPGSRPEPAPISILTELAEDVTSAVARGRMALDGKTRVLDALAELVSLMERNFTPFQGEHIIRVFLDGGIVQAVTGIPKGATVRTIDSDTDGSSVLDTEELSADDMPPWTNDDERSNGPKPRRAYVRKWVAEEEA